MPSIRRPVHQAGRSIGVARLACVILLVAVATVGSDPAAAFSDVVFFGDSLTDTGNTCALVGSVGGGFATGRCSNGPVWADYLVQGLGLAGEARSSASDGSNHANGGALTADLAGQIAAYTAAGGGLADPDALHAVWLGGNDVLFNVILSGSPPGAMREAADRIGAGIGSLAAAGARHFLVANAPDVGRAYGNPLLNPPFSTTATPFAEAERDRLSELSLEFNTALGEALDHVLEAISEVTVSRIDTAAAFDDVIDDPEAFGFSPDAVDSTSQSSSFPIACLADPACAEDPQGPVADGLLIFDSVHPTTALHRLIAERALAAVVPEPSIVVFLGSALLGLAARRRGSGTADPHGGPGPLA